MTKAGQMKRNGKARIGRKQKGKTTVTIATCPWDLGATGSANRIGLEIEDAPVVDQDGTERNPNGVKRARRIDLLERWYRLGVISKASWSAAERLRDAFEATMRAPGMAQSHRVDSSPKPDHAVSIQMDRISRFDAEWRHVQKPDRKLVEMCVLHGGTPARVNRQWVGRRYGEGLAALNEALGRAAASMGY